MSSDPKALASEVVESFMTSLDSDVRGAIGEHQLNALHNMVREAIAEHAEAIFDQLEQEIKKHRLEMVERRPLEL